MEKTKIGTIGFINHRVSCVIGILQNERVEEQDLLIDLEVKTDVSHCLLTSRIEDTIDYVALAQIASDLAKKNRFFLLEELANAIINKLLSMEKILSVRIKIKKLSAIPTADYAYVELQGVK